MIIRTLITLAGVITSVALAAQPKPVQRVILIGDAGEINHEQTTVIPDAAAKVLPGMTAVFIWEITYIPGEWVCRAH
ncbi:hypothetical protein LWM68_09730 [Niabella sp. W65]|nr:hypothetical protein [Niabella sp. W65]MCH7363022.1 hypothetical protein [Niabella sp. W65]